MPRINAATLREHHEQAWDRLIDSLEGLMAERDLDEITLADIAERAGMARNTVYNYAKDKNALFAVAAERASVSIADQIRSLGRGRGTATERIGSIVLALVKSFVAGPIHYALKRDLAGRGDTRDRSWTRQFIGLRKEVESVVLDGIASGEFRPVADIGLTVQFMAGVAQSAVDHSTSPVTADLGRIAQEATDFILAALRAPDSDQS